jgi:hypothetical protein
MDEPRFTTTKPANMIPVSESNMLGILRELKLVPPLPQEWLLASPDGKIYKGTANDLMPILAAHYKV